uniref:CP n=1 Tax=peony leafroll-associated virus TaxID=2974943 RepID=A0A977TIW3_9CLOS|nr:CP [peony leafroll-associated virus]
MALVKTGDIIRRLSDNTVYKAPTSGQLTPQYEFLRPLAQSLPTDANRPNAPNDSVTAPAVTTGRTENVTDKHVVSENKKIKVDDIVGLFKDPSFDSYYDGSSLDKRLTVTTNVPGLMTAEHAKIVSDTILDEAQKLYGKSDGDFTKALILGMLQLALTYSTSPDADMSAESCYVTLDVPGSPKLHGQFIREVVNKAVSGMSYSNPYRQYLRLFAPTTVWLIKNKKLVVNEKVAAQHGVPLKFVAMCFDFSRPDYSTYNINDIRAWQLALNQAVSRKQYSVNTTIHNTSELRN